MPFALFWCPLAKVICYDVACFLLRMMPVWTFEISAFISQSDVTSPKLMRACHDQTSLGAYS